MWRRGTSHASFCNRAYQMSVHCVGMFTAIETRWVLEDLRTRQGILTKRNAVLEETNATVGSYIMEEMRTFTSTYTVENKIKNSLWCSMQMLNTIKDGSALLDHIFRLKKAFIVMQLCNLYCKNLHVNATRYTIENMTNNVLFFWTATRSHKAANLSLPGIRCGPNDDFFPVPGLNRLRPLILFFIAI